MRLLHSMTETLTLNHSWVVNHSLLKKKKWKKSRNRNLSTLSLTLKMLSMTSRKKMRMKALAKRNSRKCSRMLRITQKTQNQLTLILSCLMRLPGQRKQQEAKTLTSQTSVLRTTQKTRIQFSMKKQKRKSTKQKLLTMK